MSLAAPVYPVGLVLAGKPCLVVGGGRVAARKARSLLEAGATVTVVAPDVVPRLLELDVVLERRPYVRGEAAAYRFVVAATGRAEVDRAVAADAEAAGVLVNAVDDPAACSAIQPALLRRGAVSVAVSTDGASPALASWLRDRLAAVVTPEHAQLARLLGDARAAVRASGRSSEGCDWRGLLDGGLAGLVLEGRQAEAAEVLHAWTQAQLAAPPLPPPGAPPE